MVDTFCRTEANRLNYIHLNQAELRIGMYQGLYDYTYMKKMTTRDVR